LQLSSLGSWVGALAVPDIYAVVKRLILGKIGALLVPLSQFIFFIFFLIFIFIFLLLLFLGIFCLLACFQFYLLCFEKLGTSGMTKQIYKNLER